MTSRKWLQDRTNGCTADDFPDASKLIKLCVEEVSDLYEATGSRITAESLVAAVLAGIVRADIKGLISVGDEHEWATLSLLAWQIHDETAG